MVVSEVAGVGEEEVRRDKAVRVGEGQLGDLEDAEGLLKQLMRGIPRS